MKKDDSKIYYIYSVAKSDGSYRHPEIRVFHRSGYDNKFYRYSNEVIRFTGQTDVEKQMPYGNKVEIPLQLGDSQAAFRILKGMTKDGYIGIRDIVKYLKKHATRMIYNREIDDYVPAQWRKHPGLWKTAQDQGIQLIK